MSIAFKPTTVAAINVRDFKTSVAWFKEHLDFELEYAVEEVGWGELITNVPNFTIGINQDPENAGGSGGATLTFSVSDIEAARGALESKGVSFDGPTRTIPGLVKLATFQDPDGNQFTFAESLQAI